MNYMWSILLYFHECFFVDIMPVMYVFYDSSHVWLFLLIIE